jgi:hypothetical protein
MTFEPAQIRQRGKKFSGRARALDQHMGFKLPRPMFPALRWKTRPMATISIGEPESSPSRHEVVDNTALRAAREVAGMAPLRAEAG